MISGKNRLDEGFRRRHGDTGEKTSRTVMNCLLGFYGRRVCDEQDIKAQSGAVCRLGTHHLLAERGEPSFDANAVYVGLQIPSLASANVQSVAQVRAR